MAVSKKDFEAIARILKRQAHIARGSQYEMVEEITEALADYFSESVPTFNRERFLTASAPDTPAERERARRELATYANLNS